jgi:heat shock protein beta
MFSVAIQPDNPAEVGGKIYNMMDVALAGRWRAPSSEAANVDAPQPSIEVVEPAEAEIVEPAEAEIVEPAEVKVECNASKN